MSEAPRPIRTLLRDGVDEPRLQEIWQRVESRRSARRSARRALLPLVAVCCAVFLTLSLSREPRAALPAVAAPAATPGSTLGTALAFADGNALSPAAAIDVAADAPPRVVALSDGTRITIGAGGRLVPRASTSARLELVVERGRARFEVQPQRGRTFVVDAGALSVEVVGTAFSVEHGEHDAAVAVEHGRVRVRARDLPGGERMLGAGESLRWPAAAPEAQAQSPSATPALTPTPASSHVSPPAGAKPASQTTSAAFRAAAAVGAYGRAYALLGPAGYARAVRAESEIDALLQLADVARGAGKSRSAALALTRIVELQPQGDRSALAALTLGRLDLDVLAQPAAAARALRIALAAGLPVALQEDALARLVDACSRAGQRADAENAAAQYRQRFPNGRWRASVEQWVNAR